MMYMLQSRAERNISEQELNDIENSTSLNAEHAGFFPKPPTKQLYRLLRDHLIYCVKKKGATQENAVHVLTKAVINFSPSPFEFRFIEDYLKSQIKGATSESKID